jgi:hypothetical protein
MTCCRTTGTPLSWVIHFTGEEQSLLLQLCCSACVQHLKHCLA